ncbi:MAG TPA: hypothetical protein VLC09_17090 [Polyangiaceae bacterium]|nr:hypothetical protein [Polyangiaceae bacterium]
MLSFDESRWPLIVVTYPEDTTEAEFVEHLGKLSANIRRTAAAQSQTALIYDITSGYRAPARVRQQQADWMKANASQIKGHCAGIAFVMTSSLVRGALTAILWMSAMPTAYTVVATVAEAESWCADRLREKGVSVPSQAKLG